MYNFMINDENKNIKLIKDLQSKDKAKSRQAFDEIYRIYSSLILKLCRIEMKYSYLADDVFQTTFIQFYEYSLNPKNEIKNLRNMLITIARNACKNELKKRKLYSFEDIEYEVADKSYNNEETVKLVDKAVASLEDKYREPLVLKEYADLSYREICEILNITEAQLTMRLFRAKKALAKILEPILKEL